MRRLVAAVLLSTTLGCASSPPPAPEPRPSERALPSPPAPATKPAPAKEDDGVEGGVIGAVAGADNAHVLPSQVRVLDECKRPGAACWGLFKVCVSTEGRVTNVETLRSSGFPEVDGIWKDKMKTWLHKPFEKNGRPVPYCYPVKMEVRADPKKPD
jgi:outer membrane biosynthesis protein TonB